MAYASNYAQYKEQKTMATTTTLPNMTLPAIDLTSRAMLASLSIKMWSARKHDKRVSAEVAQTHNSSEEMGRFNKSLLPKGALEEVQKIASAARAEFLRLTLPWENDGQRILTNQGYWKLNDAMKEFQHQWEDALVLRFFPNFRIYVDDARSDLNGLFNPADYPDDEELKGKFDFKFRISPVTNAEDFRVQLSDVETRVIRQRIQDHVNQLTHDAMQDVWGKMRDVVSHMADKLKAYKVVESSSTKQGFKAENTFRDSLVDNIRELLAVIPALNLTNSPEVAAFASEMQQLCVYDAETLRENEVTRKEVARAAEDILAKMASIV